jgi:hypothetical protein
MSTVGGAGNLIKKLLASTALVTGLGTAGAMVHANNKAENSFAPNLPSAVALNYEDVPPIDRVNE